MKTSFLTKVLFALAIVAILNSTSANAQSCTATSATESKESIRLVNQHTDDEFEAHQTWWISIFWEDNMLPALMLMASQLNVVAIKQTEVIGGFLDAKHQMETQQTLQKITARAHKNYHPTVGMCEFGSSIKSLAASERQGEANAVILSQRSMDRSLGNANTSAAAGKLNDSRSRLKQFREIYCNPKDNNNGLVDMCEHDQNGNSVKVDANGKTVVDPKTGDPVPDTDIGGPNPLRLNKDVDYVRTLDMPWTLDVNLVDESSEITADEQDVFALAANLYGREVFTRPKPEKLVADGTSLTNTQHAYMDARAVLAKRSVAENSYNALVGMKSSGTAGSRDFLEALLLELGIEDESEDVAVHLDDFGTEAAEVGAADPYADPPPEETFQTRNVSQLDALLGKNPSYYAQMEVLTKKIYQNPDFYTNLYDKPANVERKGVAMQAIALMQKFDMLKSHLRTEATQSVLLELAIVDLQDEIENRLTLPSLEGAGAQ